VPGAKLPGCSRRSQAARRRERTRLRMQPGRLRTVHASSFGVAPLRRCAVAPLRRCGGVPLRRCIAVHASLGSGPFANRPDPLPRQELWGGSRVRGFGRRRPGQGGGEAAGASRVDQAGPPDPMVTVAWCTEPFESTQVTLTF
jgi:hypothetical protein